MKILFLCGSLEPGRDGVGDYIRRLATELIRKDHPAAIVALNDHFTPGEFDGVQHSGDIQVPVLRLPSHWHPLQRFNRAGSWIDDFHPDWLSLQFVPFSFHSKGLTFGMGRWLDRLGGDRRWHIMVHELWVGMDEEAPLKFVYWGWLQRQLIKSLFIKLKPAVIHTQTNLYMKLLQKIGFRPQHLPLFGNIAVSSNGSNEEGGHIESSTDISQPISFVVFGGIHPNAPIERLAKELRLYSNNNGVKVLVKMIGRCGNEQARWEQAFKSAGIPVELWGEQSQEKISSVLSNSSFGISTTPVALIEKSGSVAAMREHGLPVLCISRAWHPRGIPEPEPLPGVVQYQDGIIPDFITGNFKSYLVNNLSSTARQFVNNLLLSS